MITRHDLRKCAGLDGAAELFRRLGYPVLLQRLDPGEWPECGVHLQFSDQWSLYHGCRFGPVDLFFLEGDVVSSRETCSQFVKECRRWNVLTRTVVVAAAHGHLSVYGADAAGKVRRLEIATRDPRGDSLERLNLLELRGDESLPEIRRRFDRTFERESITKRFFSGFRESVLKLVREIEPQCKDSEETIRDEALLILSRMLFLYFLQQKGWLDQNRSFLSDQLQDALNKDRNYFDSILQPLFFGCLNTPDSERKDSTCAFGRIPYLNGGLFQHSAFEQRHPTFTISNDVMVDIVDGLFDQYPFCVDERDEEGLHIDPEMLGKVFECLMAEGERLASGTFYTPKTIVDAMTEEAIRAFLGDVDEPDPATAERLLERLGSMRVIDPACGSGAFLLAALQTIERLTRRFAVIAGVAVAPNLRQRIVERSLFGVDLKPEAVRLCELRLWLSIVSSSDASLESVEPLPNLDRNILQGNALLNPLDFLGSSRREVYQRWSYALRARRELFDRYRRSSPRQRPALCRAIRESDQSLAIALLGSALKADREELDRLNGPVPGLFGTTRRTDPIRSEQLAARVHATERLLSRVQEGVIDFFAFDLHFAEVFAAGGFDVVLGNPPWVRASRIDPEVRRMLSDRYDLFQSGRGFDQSDVCVAFWEKAFAIAADGGVVAMLLPSKVTTASYGSALRAKIMKQAQLVSVEDWSDRARELFDADTFPVALTVRKTRAPRRDQVLIRSSDGALRVDAGRLSASGAGSPWRIVSSDLLDVLDSIRSRYSTTTAVLGRRPLMGIKTGANERFFLDDIELRNGHVRLPSLGVTVPADAVARCVRGRDVARWKVGGATWMLLPRPDTGPAWLSRAAEALRVSVEELRLAYVQPEHFGIKVAWKDVSRGLQAVVLPPRASVNGRDFNLVPNQTLYFIEALSFEEAYALSAVFNSTIFNALVLSIADRAKDSHFRYFGQTIAELPLPPIELADARIQALAKLGRRAHRGSDVSNEIDRAVADLYRLRRTELRLLEKFVVSRLG